MSRILIYSHDTYGLGNIRRMLEIATHLAGTLDDASVLMLSGSPMVQGFRIAPQVDYIKLPSVTRTARDGYSTRSLQLDADDVFELRANLLLAAVADFRPDVILVDKKPFGVANELEGAIYYAKTHLPETSLVLVLRDILDRPDATIRAWETGQYSEAIDRFYDRVLVLGTPDLFDLRREYELPQRVAEKVRFCGYVQRPRSARERNAARRELGVGPGDKLVLVTPGGGQDGAQMVRTYVSALSVIHAAPQMHSLIVTGPEMTATDRHGIEQSAAAVCRVSVREFTDDMMSYMDAADAVVCMGGYNTICEVATLRKRALVVPRVRPVEEQWIRAERLAHAGVVNAMHPDALTPETMAAAVLEQLSASVPPLGRLDLGALPRVAHHVRGMLRRKRGADIATTALRPVVAAAVQSGRTWIN